MKARRYKEGACNHIYQRTIDRFNIFYDIADYLVYYTIVSIAVQKYEVSILALCLMIDHTHAGLNILEKSPEHVRLVYYICICQRI